MKMVLLCLAGLAASAAATFVAVALCRSGARSEPSPPPHLQHRRRDD